MTPEGLCTRCSATQYCEEHQPMTIPPPSDPVQAIASEMRAILDAEPCYPPSPELVEQWYAALSALGSSASPSKPVTINRGWTTPDDDGSSVSPSSLRRDIARLLDNLYGLHCRPGHVDAVLDVIHLHAPVKTALSPSSPSASEGREAILSCGHRLEPQLWCSACGTNVSVSTAGSPVPQPSQEETTPAICQCGHPEPWHKYGHDSEACGRVNCHCTHYRPTKVEAGSVPSSELERLVKEWVEARMDPKEMWVGSRATQRLADAEAALLAWRKADPSSPIPEWKSIETAPKDGKWFWVKREPPRKNSRVNLTAFVWDAEYGGWFAGTGWWGSDNWPMGFTHWAPMAQPPVERKADPSSPAGTVEDPS